jgi:hypothetical protein
MFHQIHTYTELRHQIHDDLRIQHPEWVNSDGSSPMCDSYEARLTELLGASTRRGSETPARIPPDETISKTTANLNEKEPRI